MAVINADDRLTWRNGRLAGAPRAASIGRRTCGVGPTPAPRRRTLALACPGAHVHVEIAVAGEHNARNALAAAAAAVALGVGTTAIVRGLAGFGGSRAGCTAAGTARGALADRRHLQRQSRLGRAAIAVLRALRRPAPAGAWRHGRARRMRRPVHAEVGDFAGGGHRCAARPRRPVVQAVAAFGAGARHLRTRGAHRARRSGARAGRNRARQGLALHADGARGGRPGRATGDGTDGALMLLLLAEWMARTCGPSTCSLHHAARGAGGAHGARPLLRRRPAR